jgi:hypothetical protein
MYYLKKQHISAIMCILRYLNVTPKKETLLIKNAYCLSIEAYTNAD